MKKLATDYAVRLLTRKRQEAAQRDAERRRDRRTPDTSRERDRRTRQSRRDVAARDRKPRVIITPPDNFSLLTNTEAMLETLSEMKSTAEAGQSFFLEMKDVETITPEAIAVLDAIVARLWSQYGVRIGGSEPDSSQMAEILRRSGFYSHVRPPRSAQYIAPDTGIIAREEKSIVDGLLTQQLIHFATSRLFGSAVEHHAIYAALGEMMQNTFDHAHRRQAGHERWWASVYYDEIAQVAHFTFFDTGVGIFGSREVSGIRDRVRSALFSDAQFLKDMFEGQIASRTGVTWRGQGLPRIYQRVQRGDLTNVTVLTNAVKGTLDTGDFVVMSRSFPGTLYHWELRR